MGFSLVALLIGLNTAHADPCPQHRHNRKHTHQSRSHRPKGHWVWVPRHQVRHGNHWHTVPGHWEYRPPLNKRRKNGSNQRAPA